MKKRLFGLIGYPLVHSFSESFFNEKFNREGIDAMFKLFPIKTIKEFPIVIKANPELAGLSVTIPYKETVISFIDELDDIANKIQAVNSIKITNGKLYGYNTDIHGFKETITPLLATHHKKALVLGTGGASKAVEYVLNQIGMDITFVSRNPAKKNHISYKDLTKTVIDTHTVIVNTTPVGMFPNIQQAHELPYQFITPKHLLYDLIYNPEETIFLKRGKEKGAAIHNGLKMLHLQAEKSWEIWNNLNI